MDKCHSRSICLLSITCLSQSTFILCARIGIRSEDIQNVFEKSVRGSSMALSSPRLLIPAAIYAIWILSHKYLANDFFDFQVTNDYMCGPFHRFNQLNQSRVKKTIFILNACSPENNSLMLSCDSLPVFSSRQPWLGCLSIKQLHLFKFTGTMKT